MIRWVEQLAATRGSKVVATLRVAIVVALIIIAPSVLFTVVGVYITAYGLQGAVRRRIVVGGRSGPPYRTYVGTEAVGHGLMFVFCGLMGLWATFSHWSWGWIAPYFSSR